MTTETTVHVRGTAVPGVHTGALRSLMANERRDMSPQGQRAMLGIRGLDDDALVALAGIHRPGLAPDLSSPEAVRALGRVLRLVGPNVSPYWIGSRAAVEAYARGLDVESGADLPEALRAT